jgi:hypothetical protein
VPGYAVFAWHEDFWWPGLADNESSTDIIKVQLFPLEESVTVNVEDASELRSATGLTLAAAVNDFDAKLDEYIYEECADAIPWDMFRVYISALSEFIDHTGWRVPEVLHDLHGVRQKWLRKYALLIQDVGDAHCMKLVSIV